jgi:PadR family transcriptional regulator PadR
MTTRKDPDFVNGVPELLILRLLARQPMHGYEVVQAIRLGTDGALSFGEGCIYPLLHRLEADGCLTARWEQVAGRSRVVYRLTAAGRKRLAAVGDRWAGVVPPWGGFWEEAAMEGRRWLERVADELAGRGLPAGDRGRILAELGDHLEDLTDGGPDMPTDEDLEQRMGEPCELAAVAAAEYRRAEWVRRHPLVVFGLAPVPAALVAGAGYLAALVAAGYGLDAACGGLDVPPPREDVIRSACDALWFGVAFVPFLGVAAAFGRLAVRSGAAGRWTMLALVQVALLAGLLTVQTVWSELPEHSQLVVGFGIPLGGWRQAAQLVLPLGLGLAAYYAGRGRRPALA